MISVLARSATNIRILLLDYNIRIRLGHVRKCTLLITHLLHVLVRLHVVCWRARHLICSIWQLLILGHSQQLGGHIRVARCAHTWLRLDVVIGRLHVNKFSVDFVAVGRVFVVHAEKLVLILLSRILVIKPHLHESETATSLSLPVTHHNGVDHDAKLLKVVNEIALLGLIGQAANKQFDFMIWSLQIEIINMSL